MKKSLLTVFIILISPFYLFSQKMNFTVEDVVFNSYSKLAPKGLSQLMWIPGDTDSYSFIRDENETPELVRGFVKSEKTEVIVSLETLASKMKKLDVTLHSRFPRIKWEDESAFSFVINNSLIFYNTSTGEAEVKVSWAEDSNNLDLSPNNKLAAYTVKNNLFVSANNETSLQITADDNPGIVNGQSVHRQEFGIYKGTFWSPNSNFLAFYRMDETMVTDYPIVDLTTVPATLANIKYPMAGQTSHHVTLGVYNFKSGKTIWMKTGEPKEQYLTSVTWGPDEKYIYIALLNRDQNHLKLTKFDAATGEPITVLFEEEDDEFVEPEHPLYFIPGHNDEFLWFSERDGWDHLYRYNTEGELLNQPTEGEFPVISIQGFDEEGENVFITSDKETPTDRDFYKVNISSGALERITAGSGIHRVTANSGSNFFIDTYTSLSVPRIQRIVDGNGNVIKIIYESENPLSEYNLGKTKIFTIKSEDGTDLYCRMITPPDFDDAKEYPVIVYVYGGPHAQLVTNSWPMGRYAFWFQLMAQNGYIIFTLDNRGSANRGLEFEQATFRHLGSVEVQDQMMGVKYLQSLPYVNPEKFGVFGWSYGGFMTTSLMLRTDGAFKVGVGGGAVIDWKFYEVMYTERYMDTPQTNPEGFEEASLLNYVQNLNGKLLLVHGTSDPTVVWQNTLTFAKKAADLNKPLDYFPYPGHGHGVGGKDALHLYTKITNYFLDNLK